MGPAPQAHRTAEEDRLMVALNQASIYHWLQRPDCEDRHRSVGTWQASRIHAQLGNAAETRRFAEVCMSFSTALEPFYLGYAHEALARAARIAGDNDLAAEHKKKAEVLADRIQKKEDRDLLRADLASL